MVHDYFGLNHREVLCESGYPKPVTPAMLNEGQPPSKCFIHFLNVSRYFSYRNVFSWASKLEKSIETKMPHFFDFGCFNFRSTIIAVLLPYLFMPNSCVAWVRVPGLYNGKKSRVTVIAERGLVGVLPHGTRMPDKKNVTFPLLKSIPQSQAVNYPMRETAVSDAMLGEKRK